MSACGTLRRSLRCINSAAIEGEADLQIGKMSGFESLQLRAGATAIS